MPCGRSVADAPRVIAIDGPAASGKSSTARAVAERLGFAHLDSGALYRAFTLAAIDAGLRADGARIAALGRALPIRLDLTATGFRPEVAGTDVSEAVRTDAVTARVSEVAALPAVRDAVNALLRDAATLHPAGVVIDGRDIGTVVFPDAPLKVFLTASAAERARRRLHQEGRAGDQARLRALTETLAERDRRDERRAVAPLKPAEDAIRLDTTDLTLTEQVDRIVAMARKVFA